MNKYCLFACSDKIYMNSSVTDFIRVIQDLSQLFGIKLTHVDYSFAGDEDANTFSANEAYFNSKTIEHLNTSMKKKTISELALWSIQDSLEKSPYQSLYSELRDAGPNYGYKYVTISFPINLIEDLSMIKIFSFTRQLLTSINHLGRVNYALLTTMDSSLISTFFRGIFTSGMSDEEALNLSMWENKYVERNKFLRGLFWGNLLSADHLKRIPDTTNFLGRLESFVDDLHTTINGDDLFFMLPTTNIKSDPIARSVERLLQQHDLIMQPDDKDRETVSRLVSR